MNLFLISTAYAAQTSISILTTGVNSIYKYSISVGGILAFGLIVYAGIEYIVSAGNANRQSDAKDQIFKAILGLVILLSAAIIIKGIPGLTDFQAAEPPRPELPPVSELTPERRAEIKADVKKRLAEAPDTLEGRKQVFEDLVVAYNHAKGVYETEYNESAHDFFIALRQEHRDKEFYDSLTAEEKLNDIKLHVFGKVALYDITRPMTTSELLQTYKDLGIPTDRGYLLNNVEYSNQLAAVFVDTTSKIELVENINDPTATLLFRGLNIAQQDNLISLLCQVKRYDLILNLRAIRTTEHPEYPPAAHC